MEAGARIEYRIRWLVFTLRWVTRIAEWTPPAGFRDVQERGPYKIWIHTHTFSALDGAVLMQDRVDYELPFGILGRAAHVLVVRRQLAAIFEYRREATERIFGRP
jgi:hypothetical protein